MKKTNNKYFLTAPELKYNGMKSRRQKEQFYMIPQALADCIFNELGNASAQIRIMIVLAGTQEGFHVSESWMTKRTGLNSKSYEQARNALVARKWLTHTAKKSLIINYDEIYKNEGNLKE